MAEKKIVKKGFPEGSALILAVVLTSLLAVIAAMFLLVARADKTATSSIEQNRELDSAVDTVIARISEELIKDVPGVAGQEYYDYPGPKDPWLASNEPVRYKSDPVDPNGYRWLQISDVSGFLKTKGFATRYVNVDPPTNRKVIQEYPDIKLDSAGKLEDQLADADGDGIADSKWFELDDIITAKGRKIYAAVRIIDNVGMININTGYRLDPTLTTLNGDGSTQLQIDLEELAQGGDNVDELHIPRGISILPIPTEPELLNYQKDYIWSLNNPGGNYSPFDISDELDLRNRYCLSSPDLTRLESLWNKTIGDTPSDYNLADWQRAMTLYDNPEFCNRRPLLTTYNMDRAINPDGLSFLLIIPCLLTPTR
ncbi:MAG: hypothetical protein ACYTBV_17115 [Planctomycetota bacterium]